MLENVSFLQIISRRLILEENKAYFLRKDGPHVFRVRNCFGGGADLFHSSP